MYSLINLPEVRISGTSHYRNGRVFAMMGRQRDCMTDEVSIIILLRGLDMILTWAAPSLGVAGRPGTFNPQFLLF
jgi:hypothetical protein